MAEVDNFQKMLELCISDTAKSSFSDVFIYGVHLFDKLFTIIKCHTLLWMQQNEARYLKSREE